MTPKRKHFVYTTRPEYSQLNVEFLQIAVQAESYTNADNSAILRYDSKQHIFWNWTFPSVCYEIPGN